MAKTNKELAAENAELKKQLEAVPASGEISAEDVAAVNARLEALEKENAELKAATVAAPPALAKNGLPAGVDEELFKAKMAAGLPRDTAIEVCINQANHDAALAKAEKSEG